MEYTYYILILYVMFYILIYIILVMYTIIVITAIIYKVMFEMVFEYFIKNMSGGIITNPSTYAPHTPSNRIPNRIVYYLSVIIY